MKNNISIVCLDNLFGKKVAKAFSDKFEMYYADISDLMEFNLINKKMIDVAGQEYFDKLERKLLKQVSEYENTCITVDISTLNKNSNLTRIKEGCLLIYVDLSYDLYKKNCKLSSKLLLDELIFIDRNKILCDNADVVLKVNNYNVDKTVNEMTKVVKEYYKV